MALNGDASMAFTAGLDEVVRVYDVRKAVKPLFELRGHTDSITSLALNSDGSVLASNSMDKTLRLWDIRRAVSQERLAAGRAIAALTGYDR